MVWPRHYFSVLSETLLFVCDVKSVSEFSLLPTQQMALLLMHAYNIPCQPPLKEALSESQQIMRLPLLQAGPSTLYPWPRISPSVHPPQIPSEALDTDLIASFYFF